MGKISFPPGSKLKQIDLCFEYGEALTIQFDNSGYLSNNNSAAFSPNPPTGNFVAPVSIGPYSAVPVDSTVTFTFFDIVNGKSYATTIQIQASCPTVTG